MVWLVCEPGISSTDARKISVRQTILQAKGNNCIIMCTDNERHFFDARVPLSIYEKSQVESLGEMAGYSYGLACMLYDAAEKDILPDTIIIPQTHGLGYYPIMAAKTEPAILNSGLLISIELNGNDITHSESVYSFPEYMLNRMELFCIEQADICFGEKPELKSNYWVQREEFIQMLADGNLSKKAVDKKLFSFPDQNVAEFNRPTEGVPGLLSIVVPYYNLGETLPETLESAFASDYPFKEILLMDDASTDKNSIEVLWKMKEKYKDLQVHMLNHQGLHNLRNTAASIAKGEYITFLDSDDCVGPSYYSNAISVLQEYSNVAYVSSWVEYFDALERVEPFFNTELPLFLLKNSHTSFAVSRRELYAKFAVNKDEMRNGFEDHEAWISMAENGCFGVCIPKPLCRYRIREGSLTSQYDPQRRTMLYNTMVNLHPELYAKYNKELLGLLQANGPSQIWDSVLKKHSGISYEGQGTYWDKKNEEIRVLGDTLDDIKKQMDNWKKECEKARELLQKQGEDLEIKQAELGRLNSIIKKNSQSKLYRVLKRAGFVE